MMIKHDIIYSSEVNYDTVSNTYALFLEIGPSDVRIQSKGGEPQMVKNWRFICDGKTREELVLGINDYSFSLNVALNNGDAINDIKNYLSDLVTSGAPVIQNGFKSILDIVPSEDIKFTDEDMAAIRTCLSPYNLEDRIFSSDDLKNIKRELISKIVSWADPSEHEAAEIAEIFAAHVLEIKVKKAVLVQEEKKPRAKKIEVMNMVDSEPKKVEVKAEKETKPKPKKEPKQKVEPKPKKEPKPKAESKIKKATKSRAGDK